MKLTYNEKDDILVVRLNDNKIAKETSLDWHTHVSYDIDENVVEVVVIGERNN